MCLQQNISRTHGADILVVFCDDEGTRRAILEALNANQAGFNHVCRPSAFCHMVLGGGNKPSPSPFSAFTSLLNKPAKPAAVAPPKVVNAPRPFFVRYAAVQSYVDLRTYIQKRMVSPSLHVRLTLPICTNGLQAGPCAGRDNGGAAKRAAGGTGGLRAGLPGQVCRRGPG